MDVTFNRSHLFPLVTLVCKPRQAGRITKQCELWVSTKGMTWFIKRIKLLALVVLGKDLPEVKTRNGLIVGPFRALHAAARRNRRTKREVLAMLKFVSRYARKPTVSDYKKHARLISQSVSPTPIRIVGLEPHVFKGVIPPYPYPVENPSRYKWVGLHYEIFTGAGANLAPKMHYLRRPHGPIGQTHCLVKDGGYKFRFVFQPEELIQLATWSLYIKLKDYARKHCKNLFHEDVEAGKARVIELIRKHTTVWSIDLESATDLVPADPQFDLLDTLFPEEKQVINFLRRRYPFSSKHGVEFKHTVGQPMGLRVSFLTFSIYICKIFESQVGNEFAQVGDDLVTIPCDVLHVTDHYISEVKGLKGPTAEFCGTPIDKIGSYDITKSHRDPLLFYKQFGKRCLFSMFPRTVAKQTLVVARLPSPWGLKGSGSGLLARLTTDELEEFFKLSDIPKVLYPEDQRNIVRSLFKHYNREATVIRGKGLVYIPLDVHDTRLTAVNCIIDQYNSAGHVHPLIFHRVYNLPFLTREDCIRIPLTKRVIKNKTQAQFANKRTQVFILYNKLRKIARKAI